MQDALGVDVLELPVGERGGESRSLHYVKERIRAELPPRSINGVAEVDPHQFALLAAGHVVGDAANADPDFEDEPVAQVLVFEVQGKMHGPKHIVCRLVPVGPFVPLVVAPFAGKASQHGLFAGRTVLRGRGVTGHFPAEPPAVASPKITHNACGKYQQARHAIHDRVVDLPAPVHEQAGADLPLEPLDGQPHAPHAHYVLIRQARRRRLPFQEIEHAPIHGADEQVGETGPQGVQPPGDWREPKEA